jgi:hypothetical protein
MLHATHFAGDYSPISSIGLFGEEDWSKLTRLQVESALARIRRRVASLVLGGGLR